MEPLHELAMRFFPAGQVESVRRLAAEESPSESTRKGTGYGVPVQVRVRDAAGKRHVLVVHTARADEFGHDRRADRAQEMLLAFDSFGHIPRHVPALDVGVIGGDGRMRSIADAGELYLVTGWADGELYAQDLRRIATSGATDADVRRATQLADYLATLHEVSGGAPATYRRAVRDLLGSGEGIFGMIDGFAPDVPAAPPARLRALEEACLGWRWRLRGHEGRSARTHGDFHPFNIVFDEGGELALLDASRGSVGDPADDVTALSINYVFFALDRPGAWRNGLRVLWQRFWSRYLERSRDAELCEVAAPWLAWRALVVANPRWYPGLSEQGRDALFGWIERVLAAPRFEPASADEVFA